MANKDPSLSLDYILKKQESEKLSGLSSSVRQQLSSVEMPNTTAPEPTNKIISELQKINRSLNVGLNSNITKMTAAISKNNNLLATLVKGTNRKETPPKGKNDLTQQDIEDKDYKQKQIDLLERIVENTKQGKVNLAKTSGWLKALGFAVAGLVAALQVWASKIKAIVKFFTPSFIRDKLMGGLKRIATVFEDLAKGAKNKLGNWLEPLAKYLKETVGKIKKVLRLESGGLLSNMFESIKAGLSNIKKEFRAAIRFTKLFTTGKPFSSFFEPIAKFFSEIKKFFPVVTKLLGPLKAILGPIGDLYIAITSIYEAWKGYKEKGILGGIGGLLKGLVGGIVFGTFDLVKNIIAFILGEFGFDKAKKWLKSFSLEKMYNNMVDKVVDSLISLGDTIKDMFNSAIKWFRSIEIPAIGFTAFGKTFGAGPWHPFASNEPASDTKTPMVTASAIEVKPNQVITPAASADAVYQQSGDNQESSMQSFAAPATNIVSAPTNITRQTQNNLMKVNIRNQESTIKNYYRSRFAS
jgi:hypothetical protein